MAWLTPPEQLARVDRDRLALGGDPIERSEGEAVRGRPHRPGADDDRPRLRRLLEAGRDIDGVAGHQEVAGRRVPAGDDLAAVHPEPDREAFAECRIVPDPVAQLQRTVEGPGHVIAMRDRQTEHGHHRVADELLDGAAVALDDFASGGEVAAHQAAQLFRIERLAERGRPRHVGEEDGHQPSLLGHRRPSVIARWYAARSLGRSEPAGSPGRAARRGGLPVDGAFEHHLDAAPFPAASLRGRRCDASRPRARAVPRRPGTRDRMRRLARSRLATLAAALALASVALGMPGVVRAATTVTFVPAADAQVYSSHLTTNYGSLTTLRTREGAGTSTDPTYRSYLRFDVAGVSGQVTAVTLRLSASDPSSNGQGVYAVAPGWTEGGITYGNAPSIGGTALGSAGVPSTGYNDIVLAPSSVAGNGSIWLGIISAGTNSAIFDSREGAAPPLLVVTFGGTTPPPAKPVAAFSGTPRSGTAPLTVAFTDASTNGPTSWAWDFGDPASGPQNSATVANPSHTYAAAGTYTVTLTASNSAGSSAPLVKTDYVTATTTPPPAKPVAAFSGTPRSGTAPLTVAFTDASTNGPTSWAWDFGDPASGPQNSATVANPSHTYAAAGTYTVTLTASNSAGSSAPLVKTDYVTATTTPPPGDAVLVGAGDIADCSRTQDSKTEALLAAIPGTVFAAGDLSYPDGTAAEFANCYGPTWGLEKARTRPVIGNHEYNTSGAAPLLRLLGGRGRRSVEGLLQLRHRGLARRGPQQQLLQGGRLRHGFGPGEVAQGRPRGEQRRLHDRVLASRPVQLEPDQSRQPHAGAVAGPLRRRGGDQRSPATITTTSASPPRPRPASRIRRPGSGSSSSAPAAPGSAGSRARSWPTARSTSARPTGS